MSSGMTPEELKTLFLFEALSDGQAHWLTTIFIAGLRQSGVIASGTR